MKAFRGKIYENGDVTFWESYSKSFSLQDVNLSVVVHFRMQENAGAEVMRMAGNAAKAYNWPGEN